MAQGMTTARRTAISAAVLAVALTACSSSASKPTPQQTGANDAAVCASIARGDANVPDATLRGASLALRQSISAKDTATVRTICGAEGVSIP